eukprot:TRINITY_DN6406_c1_g1_i1.p1 TRINITY_DN6406_c1_g1~~TRINITY_DN6406_c1_g1_i1.p1  ORF type:complete len:629 (+),score=209.33 TRINITY_DN6406_c1_g1_i1:67-1887(+)
MEGSQEGPPPVLNVSAPDVDGPSATYHLVPGAEGHGMPIWESEDKGPSTKRIFVGKNGCWLVGTRKSQEQNQGWIMTQERHKGLYPQQAAGWRRWKKDSGWMPTEVSVTAAAEQPPPPPGPPPQRAPQQQQQQQPPQPAPPVPALQQPLESAPRSARQHTPPPPPPPAVPQVCLRCAELERACAELRRQFSAAQRAADDLAVETTVRRQEVLRLDDANAELRRRLAEAEPAAEAGRRRAAELRAQAAAAAAARARCARLEAREARRDDVGDELRRRQLLLCERALEEELRRGDRLRDALNHVGQYAAQHCSDGGELASLVEAMLRSVEDSQGAGDAGGVPPRAALRALQDALTHRALRRAAPGAAAAADRAIAAAAQDSARSPASPSPRRQRPASPGAASPRSPLAADGASDDSAENAALSGAAEADVVLRMRLAEAEQAAAVGEAVVARVAALEAERAEAEDAVRLRARVAELEGRLAHTPVQTAELHTQLGRQQQQLRAAEEEVAALREQLAQEQQLFEQQRDALQARIAAGYAARRAVAKQSSPQAAPPAMPTAEEPLLSPPVVPQPAQRRQRRPSPRSRARRDPRGGGAAGVGPPPLILLPA